MRRRLVWSMMFLGAVGGCMNTDTPPETGGVKPHYGKSFGPPTVPGLEGPYGAPVPMAMPYASAPPGSTWAAQRMMANSQPMSMVQMSPNGMPMMGGPGGAAMPNPMAPNGMISPLGVPALPGASPGGPGMMPGGPGMMPGGPGMMPKLGMGPMDGGVKQAQFTEGSASGVVPAQFTGTSPVSSMFPAQRTQVYFGSPVRMKIYWFTQGADGKPMYSTTPLETPGRYNFAQAAIYRLKLTNIPGRPALELYPTLEVVPTSPRTNEFLAHNSVPVDFTEEDFKQVVDRNYIVKVIYLPDPQNQDGAGGGPGEISSTQLEPGQDPIQEALRRGSILLVLRMGNIDQGLQHSPPMTAPNPTAVSPALPKPVGQGVMPLPMVPFHMPPITPLPPPAPNQLPPLSGPPSERLAPPESKGKLEFPPLPPPFEPKGKEEKKPVAPLVPPPPSEEIKLPLIPPPPAVKPEEKVNLPAAPIVPPPPPVVKPGEEIKLPALDALPPASAKPGDEPRLPPSVKPGTEPTGPVAEPKGVPFSEKPALPPLPPFDVPTEKPAPATSSGPAIPTPGVFPATSTKEATSKSPPLPPVPVVPLPEVPSMVDPLGPEQPSLPAIPVIPTPEKK